MVGQLAYDVMIRASALALQLASTAKEQRCTDEHVSSNRCMQVQNETCRESGAPY